MGFWDKTLKNQGHRSFFLQRNFWTAPSSGPKGALHKRSKASHHPLKIRPTLFGQPENSRPFPNDTRRIHGHTHEDLTLGTVS
jgi:hypothetical protein